MPSTRVTSIKGDPVDRPVNRHVVELLEDLLERARDGQINGIAVAYDRGPDAPITTVLETHGNTIYMGQALSSLWMRFQLRMLDAAD